MPTLTVTYLTVTVTGGDGGEYLVLSNRSSSSNMNSLQWLLRHKAMSLFMSSGIEIGATTTTTTSGFVLLVPELYRLESLSDSEAL